MVRRRIITDCSPRSEPRLPSFGFRVLRFELEPGTRNSELETVVCPQPEGHAPRALFREQIGARFDPQLLMPEGFEPHAGPAAPTPHRAALRP